ncbi:hypothetical protein O1M63_16825 [Streptomyces mirabilis]|nr:hypothetical protein [Streptomyces mirabilis]
MEARGAAAVAVAVAEHLAQREHNPNGLDQEQFASRVQRRQAILETTSRLPPCPGAAALLQLAKRPGSWPRGDGHPASSGRSSGYRRTAPEATTAASAADDELDGNAA